jgi:hypothetical protein
MRPSIRSNVLSNQLPDVFDRLTCSSSHAVHASRSSPVRQDTSNMTISPFSLDTELLFLKYCFSISIQPYDISIGNNKKVTEF